MTIYNPNGENLPNTEAQLVDGKQLQIRRFRDLVAAEAAVREAAPDHPLVRDADGIPDPIDPANQTGLTFKQLHFAGDPETGAEPDYVFSDEETEVIVDSLKEFADGEADDLRPCNAALLLEDLGEEAPEIIPKITTEGDLPKPEHDLVTVPDDWFDPTKFDARKAARLDDSSEPVLLDTEEHALTEEIEPAPAAESVPEQTDRKVRTVEKLFSFAAVLLQ